VCKLHPLWLSGATLKTVPSPYFKFFVNQLNFILPLKEEHFWSLMGAATITTEIYLAIAIQVSFFFSP
jgi:hypothetical protein